MADYKEVGRMNPQWLAVPKTEAITVISSVVGVGLFLAVSIALGLLSRKQWKTFD